jgi:hypothetical protein
MYTSPYGNGRYTPSPAELEQQQQEGHSAGRGGVRLTGPVGYGVLPQGAYDDGDGAYRGGGTPANAGGGSYGGYGFDPRLPSNTPAPYHYRQQSIIPSQSTHQFLAPPRAGVMSTPAPFDVRARTPTNPSSQPHPSQQQVFYRSQLSQSFPPPLPPSQEQQHQPFRPPSTAPAPPPDQVPSSFGYSVFQAALSRFMPASAPNPLPPAPTPTPVPPVSPSPYALPVARPTSASTPVQVQHNSYPAQPLYYQPSSTPASQPHPQQYYDPEAYASSRDPYPSGLRSRSPTPPLEDDLYSSSSHNHHPNPQQYNEHSSLLPPIDEDNLGDLGDGYGEKDPYPLLPPSASNPHSTTTYYDSPIIGTAPTSNDLSAEAEAATTQHFGAAPGRVLRRNKTKTKRRIALTEKGNLVVESAIPADLLDRLPIKDDPERTSMTYTAVTCGPDEFGEKGFTLRQQKYGRSTELFIVVTMYCKYKFFRRSSERNEDCLLRADQFRFLCPLPAENEQLFLRTLYGIMKNLGQLCNRKNSSWGRDGWKRVCCFPFFFLLVRY